MKDAVLIAGPTASGKSSLALDLARQMGGVVVNADSMQVYSVLSVITARPTADDMTAAPHMLYGHVHPSQAYSTGHWLRDVGRIVREGGPAGRPAIFVGGTGLYFRTLTQGLAPMPDVPEAVRRYWRERMEAEGSEGLHRLLEERDRQAAGSIRPSDGQRIVRALEVLDSSGRSICAWQAESTPPLVDEGSARLFAIEPDRALLKQRIEERFDRMVEAGALDEVRALEALRLDPAMPAMKAIGVRELGAALRGELSLDEAIARAKAATRQYAKRQATWFRHQLGPAWSRIRAPQEALAEIAP